MRYQVADENPSAMRLVQTFTPATQEPYDKSLITDQLRTELHVPKLSEQEEQRKQFDAAAQAKPAK